MLRVMVISPLSPTEKPKRSISDNMDLLYKLCADLVTTKKIAPWAPHGFYPYFLDENNIMDRALGIECGLTWLLKAHAAVVWHANGVTRGMREEIEACSKHGIPVFFWDDDQDGTTRVVEKIHAYYIHRFEERKS